MALTQYQTLMGLTEQAVADEMGVILQKDPEVQAAIDTYGRGLLSVSGLVDQLEACKARARPRAISGLEKLKKYGDWAANVSGSDAECEPNGAA